jgi:hypothetical protein
VDPPWACPPSSHTYQPPGIVRDVTTFDMRVSGNRKMTCGSEFGLVDPTEPPSEPGVRPLAIQITTLHLGRGGQPTSR